MFTIRLWHNQGNRDIPTSATAYPWSEIARGRGPARHRVVSRFRRLLALADMAEYGRGARA
jgi:hypothetical protein